MKYFNLKFSYYSLITLLFYFFVKNALTVIRVGCLILILLWVDGFKARSQTSIKIESIHPQVFAKEVIEKVQELDQEKMKTEKAFHDFLPLTIVRDIKLKKVVILT